MDSVHHAPKNLASESSIDTRSTAFFGTVKWTDFFGSATLRHVRTVEPQATEACAHGRHDHPRALGDGHPQ